MIEHHEHRTHVCLAEDAIDEVVHDPAHDHHGDAGDHGGHGAHHGHHVATFRTRFWWSLLLTVPLVATSHMVMGWFGYSLDFAGIEWVGAVLGTIVFAWGGQPFLAGGLRRPRRARRG